MQANFNYKINISTLKEQVIYHPSKLCRYSDDFRLIKAKFLSLGPREFVSFLLRQPVIDQGNWNNITFIDYKCSHGCPQPHQNVPRGQVENVQHRNDVKSLGASLFCSCKTMT